MALFSGVKDISRLATQIMNGEVELNQKTAKKLADVRGGRYSKQEEEALLALDKAIVADLATGTSKVKADDVGLHVFRSIFVQDTQSRFSKGLEQGQVWSSRAATIATVIGGGGAAVAGAMAGATLAVAAPAALAAAGAAFILAKIGGAIVGFLKGLVQN